jgi:hypothetical protein
MALTAADLALLAKRNRLQAKANDPTVSTSIAKVAARKQLLDMDRKIAAPTSQAPIAPPAAPVTPLPVATPGPATSQVPPPAQEPPPAQQPPGQVGQLATLDAAPPVPSLDDAAARVAAQQPGQVLQDLTKRRKRYGIAATTLTGETGLGSLGGIASRSLLG